MTRLALRVLCLLLLLSTSACVTLRSRDVALSGPWPPRASAKPAPIELRIFGNQSFETSPADLELEILQLSRQAADEAYQESRMFSAIAPAWSAAPVVAEVTFLIRRDLEDRSRSVLSSSLRFRRTEILMRTRFRDARGRTLGSVRISESLRTYGWLMSSSSPEAALRSAFYDLNRATLMWAARRKIFTKPVRSAPATLQSPGAALE